MMKVLLVHVSVGAKFSVPEQKLPSLRPSKRHTKELRASRATSHVTVR